MEGFTYYGDLLGISAYYKLSPNVAYKKLNDFYNETFLELKTYCRACEDVKVSMFSDSLIVWGNDVTEAFTKIEKLYIRLLAKNLLIRGAIVKGKLCFDPRLTVENFEKRLPRDDTLARAVGFASLFKGARLLVENDLAVDLLKEFPDWLTQEGYISNIRSDILFTDFRRRIAHTPDCSTYECLYFDMQPENRSEVTKLVQKVRSDLTYFAAVYKQEIAEHYNETISLLDRASKRQSVTFERLRRNNEE